jgi:hypothetical protein
MWDGELDLRRPKGMWQRTYERHWTRYWELNAQCSAETTAFVDQLEGRVDIEGGM